MLRRFTGDVTGAAATAQVTAAYHAGGVGSRPLLLLRLANGADQAVMFTVTPNNYSAKPPGSYEVPTGHTMTRRYTGHLVTGAPSVTG